MIVQIYETRSGAEARALSACGVDHIGVLVGFGVFPRELDPAAARAVFAACPAGVMRVALSLSADLETIGRVIAETRPDIVHLGAAAELLSAAMTATLKTRHPSCRIMRSIPVIDAQSIALARAYQGIADFLLLDSHRPGDIQIGAQGRTHDWAISRRIAGTVAVPAILAGGLGPDTVAEAIRAVRPAGVDSKTLTDRADGAGKDLNRVARFVTAARGA